MSDRVPDQMVQAPSMLVQNDQSKLQQQQTAAKDKLKVALAVAITAKKKQVQRDGVDWKKKALAARQTLLAVSKTLKSSGQASNDLHGKIIELLGDFSDTPSLQDQQQPQQITAVAQRSSNLSAFIDATQVQSLILSRGYPAAARCSTKLPL